MQRDLNMEKHNKKIDIAFIVLIYANCNDVLEFLESIKKIDCNKKIILVDSFYNTEVSEKIKHIANINNCDYIAVQNKGYGFGNNAGIRFCLENYKSDFIVISNPDIIIEKFEVDILKQYEHAVVGPKILTSTGKNQNPFFIKKKLFPWWENLFLRYKFKFGYFSLVALNKIHKLLYYFAMRVFNKNSINVYAVHGSFIILPAEVIKKIYPVFDENIFLFTEEIVLAEKMKANEIVCYYDKRFIVHHKEDGCMKFLSGSMYDEEVKSNTYVLNHYLYKKQ